MKSHSRYFSVKPLLFLLLLASTPGSGITQAASLFPLSVPVQLQARVNHYDYERYNAPRHRSTAVLPFATSRTLLKAPGSDWEILLRAERVTGLGEIWNLEATFRCLSGTAREASVSIDLSFTNWSESHYVLLPGSVYNGNRFPYRRISYSPKLLDPRDIGPDIPTIISDVPRLDQAGGPSRIQQRSGDMTTPAIGFHDPERRQGFWLLTEVGTSLGDSGIDIEETRDRSRAVITVTAPVVREYFKYHITDSRWPSDDRPADFRPGDEVTLRLRLHFFPAPELQDLFDYFCSIRKSFVRDDTPRVVLPFSSAFTIQEQKFNTLNWVSDFGYYSVGPRNMFLQDWQIGWTGGMISTFPLLWMGADSTRGNVLRNFDWLFPDGLAPSGLFWDCGEHGNQWYGGDIRKPHTRNWHLIRKSGDGLFYIIKQFRLMEKLGIPVKPAWREGARGVADALVRIWRTEGQFGQFVDNPTGKVIVGGSTSGGIIPAALTLASAYYSEPVYLNIARQAASHYYDRYVSRGLTTGGPGDALQNPDSESCYALLESFITLYESTHDTVWLHRAEDIAHQFATWVYSYNYPFPPSSLFGREGMHSTGAVMANTQNKHGAPGICTHSGVALLKLFRATGTPLYAELLHDIARNMPQYLPHPLKPIEGAQTGWMCERVSTTDWLEGIGEISYLTTWSETALLLTYAEIPGLYVQPDRGIFLVFDNIEATLLSNSASRLSLRLTNPTVMPARVKLLVENAAECRRPLGEPTLWNCRVIELEPGQSKDIDFQK